MDITQIRMIVNYARLNAKLAPQLLQIAHHAKLIEF